MGRALTIFASLMLLSSASVAEGSIKRVLLSVDGLELRPGEVIRAYHVNTWGVEFLSVCHLPQSWQISSEKFEDPEGRLDGKSDVHGAPLRKLSDMYLVDVYDYQTQPKGNPRGSYHPATFSGWATVGTMTDFAGGTNRRIALRTANFRIKAAAACPTAPLAPS